MAQTITGSEFGEVILKQPAVLADFYSETCVPCRQMMPVLEELEYELGDRIKAVKIDVSRNGDLADEYGVRAVPTFVLFKNGRETARIVGAVPKSQLTELVNSSRQ